MGASEGTHDVNALVQEFVQFLAADSTGRPWSVALNGWLARRALPPDVERAVRDGVLRDRARAIVARHRPRGRRTRKETPGWWRR